MMRLSTIHSFWVDKARTFHTSNQASWGDLLMVKEVKEITKYLRDGDRILDVGCANGYSSLQYVKKKRIQLLGIDYVKDMVAYANKAKKELPPDIAKRVMFRLGDATKLDVQSGYYDVVISTRCLCNMISWKEQKAALLGMWSALKPGGILLLSEPTYQGLDELNKLCKIFQIRPMSPPWHNLYINEKSLTDFSKKYFTVKIDNFSGTYYLFSRILYRWIMGDDTTKLKRESLWNKVGITLPGMGAWGVQRLYIMKKKVI